MVLMAIREGGRLDVLVAPSVDRGKLGAKREKLPSVSTKLGWAQR